MHFVALFFLTWSNVLALASAAVLALNFHLLFCNAGQLSYQQPRTSKVLSPYALRATPPHTSPLCCKTSLGPWWSHKLHISGLNNQNIHSTIWISKYIAINHIGGVWDYSTPRFSALLHAFLAKRFQLYARSSRKKDGVVRPPKEKLHELQVFVELFHGWVCRAVPNTPILNIQLKLSLTMHTSSLYIAKKKSDDFIDI